MNFYKRYGKRLSDLLLSVAGLCVLLPVFLVIAIAIKTGSRGPVFFRQVRAGRHMRPFRIVKFRTMVHTTSPSEKITVADDMRLTRLGRFLRSSKLDELPQLWNVIRGEMSIVGPRPELQYFVLHGYSDEQRRVILSVRPGLTDPFALRYIDQDEVPAGQAEPVDYYQRILLPTKIDVYLEFLEAISLKQDARLMMATLLAIVRKAFGRGGRRLDQHGQGAEKRHPAVGRPELEQGARILGKEY